MNKTWTVLHCQLFTSLLVICSSVAKKKQVFHEFALFIYFSVSLAISWNTDLALIDLMGLRPAISQYLALVAAVVLMSLLYLGNIITLASSDIKSRPPPRCMLDSIGKTMIFSNSAVLILLFNGWTLNGSIFFSSLFSGILKNSNRNSVNRIEKFQKVLLSFFETCLESYVFLMTGSSLALWFVSVTNCLIDYPDYLEGHKRNVMVEIVHLVSVMVFSASFPLVLNPYHFSGVFYKVHVDFNFI